MGKGPGLYSDIGKRARDLLNKDYQADQKFTITTYSPTGVKLKKEPSFKASSSRKKTKDGDEDGSKKKKQKKKKDPNAPKRAISAFMFFSQTERENVKKNNPGISFTEVGKELGDRWNKLTAEEKAPYEAKARADKKRYSEEIKGYKNPQASTMGLAEESDSE